MNNKNYVVVIVVILAADDDNDVFDVIVKHTNNNNNNKGFNPQPSDIQKEWFNIVVFQQSKRDHCMPFLDTFLQRYHCCCLQFINGKQKKTLSSAAKHTQTLLALALGNVPLNVDQTVASSLEILTACV